MEESDVKEMASRGLFRNAHLAGRLEETHISWVILTRKYAFKIKKPLKLPFLDFSTTSLRQKYCHREVSLNSRFTDIYLGVLPLRLTGGQWSIGESAGELKDYAVWMKRMAVRKRMDNQLRSGSVRQASIKSLALQVASFHQDALKIFSPFDLSAGCDIFNDINTIAPLVSEKIGHRFHEIIQRSMQWSNAFLKQHQKRIQERIDRGFKRDVHGDLHAGNIFLYRKPVLFDCIEFNDHFRQIDVLYEIAFLCMDLERFQQAKLARGFLSQYRKHFRCFELRADEDLFVYFKCLRANIRAKVHALSVKQADTPTESTFHVRELKGYLLLMKRYMS